MIGPHRLRHPARVAPILMAGSVGLFACTGVSTPASHTVLAWPPQQPRVRLEGVVALADGLRSGRNRWLRVLTGRAESFLVRRPYAVSWWDGDLVVTDPGSGSLLRVTTAGRLVAHRRQGFESPVGIAACGHHLVVADSVIGGLARLDPQLGEIEWLATDLERPTGVACSDGVVFVAETGRHRILRIPIDATRDSQARSHGERLRELGGRGSRPGRFNFPTALTLAGGALWVADTLNFRVQQLDPATGRAITSFGTLGDAPGEMPRLKGLGIDGEGRIWVSDGLLDQVALFDPDGAFLIAVGGRGSGPGEFSFPAGIAVSSDGRIAVVDSLNRRVQIFRSV